MEPLSRPRWTQGYFPIGADGYQNHLYRVGGYTTNMIFPGNPCQDCQGFATKMQCQYGRPCSKNICGRKPDFVGFAAPDQVRAFPRFN